MYRNDIYKLIKRRKFKKFQDKLVRPGNEYVLIKYLYCGICGGDYSHFIGQRTGYPLSLGHEFIAEVVESDAKSSIFKKGDLVVSDFNYRCNECSFCIENKSHLCYDNDIQRFTNRAFSLYGSVHFSYLLKVNDLYDNIISGTLIEPLSCVIHAVKSFNPICNNNILIIGTGSIGMLFAFYLKIVSGFQNVYIYDKIYEREKNIVRYFNCIKHNKDIRYDIIIEATNDLNGLKFAIESSPKASTLCIMSHLYGLNTSECFENIQKKELKCYFPLRNGEFSNLENAYMIIKQHWKLEYNNMFSINDLSEINQVFKHKHKNTHNKQIIKTY